MAAIAGDEFGARAAQIGGGVVNARVGTASRHPMLPSSQDDIVDSSSFASPQLICIVDAEEEFDWSRPFSASNNSVANIKAQSLAQAIFDRFGIVPTYAVDYPVASQEEGFGPLRELVADGRCEIGAQLHPWVTPPFEEIISEESSFTCNLPYELQSAKTASLTTAIEKNFGLKPKLFRTGRYGAGPATIGLLQQFGYELDCSVLPGPPITKFSPDYSSAPAQPYWLASGRDVLELPVTAGLVGPLRNFQDFANFTFRSSVSGGLRLPAVLARAGLLNRVRLSPEGHTLGEAKSLTRTLLGAGQRVFAMSYHSPSLVPGKTPYTRDASDVRKFLSWIEGFLEFFMSDIGGVAATPGGIRKLARPDGPAVAGRPSNRTRP